MSRRLPAAIALIGAAAALSACETAKSLNPLASSSPYKSHCRAALDYLVARESEKQKISVEDTDERRRDESMAVTIVYVQGESRRLFTCLYDPDRPNRITAVSYRGQALPPAQLDEVNAAAAARR
ncbi:MAG: hypothetical protein KIT16_18975 [Rhodospirillaceae bacterium]|nr:hypothetical protein [Rhodospirillaceae bacterium]